MILFVFEGGKAEPTVFDSIGRLIPCASLLFKTQHLGELEKVVV